MAHPTEPPPGTPTRTATRLSPKRLLLSKWTAVTPSHKEKHFLVIRVVEPEPPATRIEQVEIQAVHSSRSLLLPWRELTDATQWRRGWV